MKKPDAAIVEPRQIIGGTGDIRLKKGFGWIVKQFAFGEIDWHTYSLGKCFFTAKRGTETKGLVVKGFYMFEFLFGKDHGQWVHRAGVGSKS